MQIYFYVYNNLAHLHGVTILSVPFVLPMWQLENNTQSHTHRVFGGCLVTWPTVGQHAVVPPGWPPPRTAAVNTLVQRSECLPTRVLRSEGEDTRLSLLCNNDNFSLHSPSSLTRPLCQGSLTHITPKVVHSPTFLPEWSLTSRPATPDNVASHPEVPRDTQCLRHSYLLLIILNAFFTYKSK